MKYKLICNNRDGECQEPLSIDQIDGDYYVWCDVCQGGTDLKYWLENMARVEAALDPKQTNLTVWVYDDEFPDAFEQLEERCQCQEPLSRCFKKIGHQ